MKAKRITALILAMLMVFLLAACGSSSSSGSSGSGSSTGDSQGEGTTESADISDDFSVDETRKTTANSDEKYEKITIAINTDPQDLSPFNPNSGSKPYIVPNIYEALFDLENGEYVPVLAKGYEVVDELHWDVEIYDYIYDSDGNHITADDVIYSYQILLDSGYAIKYDVFNNVEKIGDYEVEFTWNYEPVGVAELEFPWCRTYIVSQESYESKNFAVDPVGTGAYTVTSFTSGSSVILEANENYWQTDESLVTYRHTSNVQTVEYDVLTETSQHVIALESGTLDYTEYLPYESISEFTEGGAYSDEYNVLITQGSLCYFLLPDTRESSPCSDLNLRLAIFYALDNDSIAAATGGTGVAAAGMGSSFFSDYVTAWDTMETYVNTYDPEKAAEYLAQSSYNGEELVLLTGNDETVTNIATMVQALLLQVGINVKLDTYDTTTIGDYQGLENTYDLFLNTGGGGFLISTYNRMYNSADFSNGLAGGVIDDPELINLYNIANTADTHTDENMTALMEYVCENGYSDALVTLSTNIVISDDVAELAFRENEFFLPGGSTYYLD